MAAPASSGQLRHLFNCNCRTFALATNVFPFRWPLQLPYPSPLPSPSSCRRTLFLYLSVLRCHSLLMGCLCSCLTSCCSALHADCSTLTCSGCYRADTEPLPRTVPPPHPFGYYKNNFAYKLRHELSELMQLLVLAISASTLHSLPTPSQHPSPSFVH